MLAPGAPDERGVHRMLDAIGSLVQLVGVCAVNTAARPADHARGDADRWRRHLTTGFEHPRDVAGSGMHDGATADDGTTAPVRRGLPLAERDFAGAVRWATSDRQAERAHLVRAVGELQDTTWALVRGLHGVVGAEAAAGRTAAQAVSRVHEAIRDSDADRLRDAALAAVGELASTLAERERARERHVAALGREVATLGAALEEARRESTTDALTGLGNRRAFDVAVGHAVALHGLWGQPVCLVLGDVDGLKAVNDQLGHQGGDDALRLVARQLSRVFLGRTDVLARIGGDEFAVVLRDVTPAEGVRLGERLTHAVDAARDPEAPVGVGVSLGVAALGADEDAATWVARADAALYVAKRDGRGRVELG
jgi:diguanylate cyclase (GGDEF)-like protein